MGVFEFVTLIMKKNGKDFWKTRSKERLKEKEGINTVSDISVRQVCCRLTRMQQPGLSKTD